MRGIRHLAAFVVVLGAVSAAAADPDATKLFEDGRALAAAGKVAEACAKYEQSLALERAIGTEMNLADCRQRDGKLAEAWRLFDEAARTDTKPGRAKFARERADALVAQTAEIVLRLYAPATPGLEITVAGRRVVISAEIHERVDPGSIHVVASAPDRQPFSTDAKVTAGSTNRVEVPPLSSAVVVTKSPSEPSPPLVQKPRTPRHRRSSRVLASGVLAGAGVVALAVAGGLAISARGQYRDAFDGGHCVASSSGPVCDDVGVSTITKAGSRADVATGVAIGGALLVGAGVVVFVTAPRDPDEGFQASLGTVAGGWGFAVSGRF